MSIEQKNMFTGEWEPIVSEEDQRQAVIERYLWGTDPNPFRFFSCPLCLSDEYRYVGWCSSWPDEYVFEYACPDCGYDGDYLLHEILAIQAGIEPEPEEPSEPSVTDLAKFYDRRLL
jgi:hypothetical protein